MSRIIEPQHLGLEGLGIGTAFLWHGRPLKKAKNGVHLNLGGHHRLKRWCQEGVLPGRLRIAYLDQAFTALLERLGIALNSFPALVEHRDAFFRSSQSRIDRLQKDGAPYINDISFFRKVFRERTGITVSTIHGVKGAEYDVVIAFGLLEGMVPHFTEAASLDAANKLLYVVGSRARKNLHLISESGRSQGRYGHYAATEVLFSCAFDYDAAE